MTEQAKAARETRAIGIALMIAGLASMFLGSADEMARALILGIVIAYLVGISGLAVLRAALIDRALSANTKKDRDLTRHYLVGLDKTVSFGNIFEFISIVAMATVLIAVYIV